MTRPRARPRTTDATGITRETLLAAALQAFAELGFEGMSLRELSRRVGISHGLLNIRFGTKEQLWKAAVEFGLEEMETRLRAAGNDGPIKERFHRLVVASLESIASMPALLQIVNSEGTRPGPRLDFIAQAVSIPGADELNEIVSEGVAAGMFHDMSPQLLRAIIGHGGGLVFGLRPLATRLGLLTEGTPDELSRRAEEIADFVLRGLLRQDPLPPAG